MSGSKRRTGAVAYGGKQELRQTGRFEWHPDGCGCRKCRRAAVARAGRVKPRFGQS